MMDANAISNGNVPNAGLPPDPRREEKSHWGIWFLVIIVVLGGVYFLFLRKGTGSSMAKPAFPGVPITAATAREGDVGVYLDGLLGTVTPVYTVTVMSRVQGEITNVYYREGQMVHKGDPLLDIDPRPYEAALTQAEGQLAHDQAVLGEARIDLDRYQAAFSRNAIAKQQLDDQQQIVLQQEGTVKNDEGALANARVNLVYTHITSPIDGRVGLRLVDPGNIVQANSTTPLVVVTQLQPITVIFGVTEGALPQMQSQLRQGHKMTVDALDPSEKTTLATTSVLTLDNQIDTTTGNVKVKAIFPNKDTSLFPNQFVNVRLLVDTQHNATLVPTAAIQLNAQGTFVYVVKSDGTASMRAVTRGTSDGNSTAVEGVTPGEVVAISGFDKLQDGAKVVVRTGKGGPAGSSRAQGAGSPNRGSNP
jgi:multidrug efflux system membrane fusion protein